MLLFFLHELDLEITRNQLYTVFAEQNWMDYFEFQTNLEQLEEDAFVAAIPCAYGQGYRITPHGQNMLQMFQKELPHSVQEKLGEYARRNRELLMSRSQVSATQSQLPDGGYLAVLRLMDKNARILDISLQLPTAHLARQATERWPEQAEGIYQEILTRLFPKEG